jgi:hypothetical protein
MSGELAMFILGTVLGGCLGSIATSLALIAVSMSHHQKYGN